MPEPCVEECIEEIEKHSPSKRLVVLLHSYKNNPESLHSVRDAVHKKLEDADILIPRMPTATLSMADPNMLVKMVLCMIDCCWTERQQREDRVPLVRTGELHHGKSQGRAGPCRRRRPGFGDAHQSAGSIHRAEREFEVVK